MFTGLVEGTGRVESARRMGDGLRIRIAPRFRLEDPKEGESIAVSGVCLTALEISEEGFSADLSPETLSRTTLGRLRPGSLVNLERALRPTDRLGGHFVTGHVDTVGRVLARREERGFIFFTFGVDSRFERYLIEKGSVAVDGVSLTVNRLSPGAFEVAIIPHTAGVTTLGELASGDEVNIEFDLLGKYIERLLKGREPGRGLTEEVLRRHGFL